MATLYTHKDSNIRKTWFFITSFLLFIIGLGWFLSYWLQVPEILWIAAGFSIFTSIGSYWWSDKLVLAMTHAKPIAKEQAPELYRIVENLCITAGLPMPKIYILEERALNAFATGRNPEHAVIAVTRGLLESMERAELDGVLAHELSHIGNRDMLVSTVMVVLAGIITMIVDMTFRMMWHGGGAFGGQSRDRRGSGGAVLMVVGIIVLVLAPILATLMRLAVSRQREFLADASGSLLTRYPEGLARALEKIAVSPERLSVANDATAHLYFENPFKADSRGAKGVSWVAKLFMTHPPVEERIARLRGMQ